MSKRAAHSQITKDGAVISDEEIVYNDEGSIKTATSAVMATRKILKPRGKNGSTFGASNGGSLTASSGGVVSSNGSNTNDSDNRIKALNDKFVESINKANTPGTIANFTSIAEKYITYYAEIQTKATPIIQTGKSSTGVSTGNGTLGFQNGNSFNSTVDDIPPVAPVKLAPVKAAPTNPFSFLKPQEVVVDSQSDSEPEPAKIEGPKFTLQTKPTVKRSPFTFGPKPVKKKVDSDLDSEIELQGPTFTFNKVIKDSVFKVAPVVPTAPGVEDPKVAPVPTTPFTFGKGSTPAVPSTTSFNFGATKPFSFGSKPVDTKPESTQISFDNKQQSSKEESKSFSFGGKSESKPFSFGGTDSKLDTTSLFSLGNTPVEANAETSRPFSFGSKPVENTAEVAKPFSHGSTEAKPDEPKPFSFGNKPEAAKPFSFGSSDTKSFSFGSKTESTNADAGNTPDINKPFTFGNPKESTEQPKKTFSFGDNKVSSGKEQPTPFSFNKPEVKSVTLGTADKPFAFGKPEAPFAETTNKPFTFNTGKPAESAVAPFSFAFGGQTPLNVVTKKNDDSSELVEEEETGGNFKPVVQLSEKVAQGTGEEDETLKYTKRAKLMLYDGEKYINKGTGDLKILKNNISGKTRILIRADGGLRAIFNTLVVKDITYSSLGLGNMVRVPVINENKELESYVVQVKTAADGSDLLGAINEGKQ